MNMYTHIYKCMYIEKLNVYVYSLSTTRGVSVLCTW